MITKVVDNVYYVQFKEQYDWTNIIEFINQPLPPATIRKYSFSNEVERMRIIKQHFSGRILAMYYEPKFVKPYCLKVWDPI